MSRYSALSTCLSVHTGRNNKIFEHLDHRVFARVKDRLKKSVHTEYSIFWIIMRTNGQIGNLEMEFFLYPSGEHLLGKNVEL